MEKAKLVVEGAGAVGVAALLGRQTAPAGAARRSSCSAAATSTPACWPRSRAATRARPAAASSSSRACPTGPARWRACSRWWARRARNLVDVEHVREGLDLHVRETAVQLVLETRGREHADDVLARVRDAGYEARVVR